ncbi:MAG: DNA-binding response regulator [Actinobacteria bacterium]|nr:MAG: DNA-binding response regulator [Actinomycetota bacterium]
MRVVVLEDTVLLQEGLVRLLAGYGHETVAQLVTAEGLVEAVETHNPDLVIADVRLPPTFTDEGILAAVALRTIRPSQPILILSQYVEERYASELLGGDASGLGYLLKERVADVKDFIDACNRVAEGGTVLDPEVVAQLLARRRREPLDTLTAREREVLSLMAEGRSNVGIARKLVISEGAVEKHISSVFAKLGLTATETEHRRVLAVLEHLRAT